ncbi:MAG: hypothetical protein ABI767_08615 [Rhodanobacter sp.]
MKYETLILQTLFAACLLVCVLTFGTMLTYHAPTHAVAAMTVPATTGHSAPQAG